VVSEVSNESDRRRINETFGEAINVAATLRVDTTDDEPVANH